MSKLKQIKIVISLMVFVCFDLVSFVFASEIFGSLNTANFQNTVNNCNPLTVAHGTVGAYPECLITCDTGYAKNNNICVVVSGGGGGGGGSSASIFGDLTNDSKVDILDFNILMMNWGKTGSNISGDLNHDGVVDILDFNMLMMNWGK
jgi:hypothetical protein